MFFTYLYIILGSIIFLALLAWWILRAIRTSLCCGTCGCNLISEKQKKKALARRKKKAMKKANCQSCPHKKSSK